MYWFYILLIFDFMIDFKWIICQTLENIVLYNFCNGRFYFKITKKTSTNVRVCVCLSFTPWVRERKQLNSYMEVKSCTIKKKNTV